MSKAIQSSYHSYFGHHHLAFDRAEGQREFRETINRIFARNGLAFKIEEDGRVYRMPHPILGEALAESEFATGDHELDKMLTAACSKFLAPDPTLRRESLEKLWDSWERLKTLEPGDKKESVQRLLDKAADVKQFRAMLDAEAKALTSIGNTFQIRHSETNQIPITDLNHVDYLFHRLFAMISLLLKSTEKGKF